jgi:hypothetical protein
MAKTEEPKAPKPNADQAACFKLADIELKEHTKPASTIEFRIDGSPVLIAEYWWRLGQLKLYAPDSIYPPEIEPEERQTEKSFSDMGHEAAFAMVVKHLLAIFPLCNAAWFNVFADDDAEPESPGLPETVQRRSDDMVSWMLSLFEKILLELVAAPHTALMSPEVIKNRAVGLVGEAQQFYSNLQRIKVLAQTIDTPEAFMAQVEELLGLRPDDDDEAENEDVDEDEDEDDPDEDDPDE